MAARAFSNHIALGAWVIVGAASCTPAPDANLPQALAQPIADPKLLLTRLGLQVPVGPLAETALKPVADLVGGAVGAAAPAFIEAAQTPDDAARALDCLTAAVYYEARSENDDGQRAVAQVVLNRVRNRAFPNSVCGVVYQGSTRRTGCQFTFTCDGSLYHARDPNAWERAKSVAQAALSGSVFAPVGAATSYHTTAILPWWAPSLTRITTIGAHIFYRWRNGLENALGFGQSYGGAEPSVSGGGGFAAPGAIADAYGVSVHYGIEASADAQTAGAGAAPTSQADAASNMVAGVTIHRGISTAAALGTKTVFAASAPVPVTRAVEPATAHGVHVHRANDDLAPAETTSAD